ncbi:hypothetical protein [Gordonia paraffinivorans]|uniref:hypothetical protein n=1 Tax=Gordonia paraffinivorans TaxID=175628 RepID=UPI00144557E4|nr:hypothetical protein [Gordonia paraffinivorans]
MAVNRRCAVYGYEIPAGSNCYRAFSQADAARMRGFERERSNNLINPGGSRGTLATVFGFENFGVLVTRDLFDPNQPPMFGYYSMIADHRYRKGAELAGLLEEAIVTDRPVIAASAPPLFWDESPGAQSALRASATRVHRILSNMKPAGERMIQGFGRYLEYEM